MTEPRPHKSANVLNKLPKSLQPKAKGELHEIWHAERIQEIQAGEVNSLVAVQAVTASESGNGRHR